MNSIAIYYLKTILPAVQEAARACGYAVGIHGSMQRDFDLIAAPWTKDAVAPRELAAAVMKAVSGFYKPPEDDAFFRAGCPGSKPHGRLVWSIHLGGGAYIDMSVMPKGHDMDGNEIVAAREEEERLLADEAKA